MEEQHFQSSEKVRDFVIGMSDGLTVPFALAAGLSGAIDSTSIVITAGLAEIAAGSIAMGLGGYLAGRTQIEHYSKIRTEENLTLLMCSRTDIEGCDLDEPMDIIEVNRRVPRGADIEYACGLYHNPLL